MPVCLHCRNESPESARFCGACGAGLIVGAGAESSRDPAARPAGEEIRDLPTRTSLPSEEPQGTRGAGPGGGRDPGPRAAADPASGRRPGPLGAAAGPDDDADPWSLSVSARLEEGRFAPGAMLAGRYRIVGLIGRGGMGEVYRADDLTLGQRVALKFLPEEVGRDPGRLSRFFNEVRSARLVTHPNVCRVHDVGLMEGHHFISMEYVDGEDLATLLRRIGRLPRDKAVEIARQLCAGLAAAHEQGILHRDLKPANVMIDGRGRVRIADFGLAGLADGIVGDEIGAGTPGYMAPEQTSGREVTVRSDIYALGLVLYETFTGRRAFPARSMAELARLQETSFPPSPATLVEGLDPAVERVILRCLEKDPAKRPRSALAVAAALPGGDPIAAALAAGETPAPELLAEAGKVGGLAPHLAWACLLAVAVGLAVTVALSARTKITSLVALDNPPDVLVKRARDLIALQGPTLPARGVSYGYIFDERYFQEIAETDRSPRRWDRLSDTHPPPVSFWYRQSPRTILPLDRTLISARFNDPPATTAGMVSVLLDPSGRLAMISRVPPRHDEGSGPWPDPDWTKLLAETGLDPESLVPVAPRWTPRTNTDSRLAWEGHYPGRMDPKVRVEVGSFRGRPYSLEAYMPWEKPPREVPLPQSFWTRAGGWVNALALLGALAGSALVARRNYRLGRGDRKGSFRIAGAILALYLSVWALAGQHVADLGEFDLFIGSLGVATFLAMFAWSAYMALEPYVRRIWPHWLVSWVRLLDGRLRDPLVGRDLLLGVLLALAMVLLSQIYAVGASWLGLPPPRPDMLGSPGDELASLLSLRHAIAHVLWVAMFGIIESIALAFLMWFLRSILRRQWLAFVGTLAIMTLIAYRPAGNVAADLALAAAGSFLFLGALNRFGLLMATTGFSLLRVLVSLPVTTDLTRWHATSTFLGIGILGGIALYGFILCFGGKPILRDLFAQD